MSALLLTGQDDDWASKSVIGGRCELPLISAPCHGTSLTPPYALYPPFIGWVETTVEQTIENCEIYATRKPHLQALSS